MTVIYHNNVGWRVKTHPLVSSVVSVCDVRGGPGGVQSFGVFKQGPIHKKKYIYIVIPGDEQAVFANHAVLGCVHS